MATLKQMAPRATILTKSTSDRAAVKLDPTVKTRLQGVTSFGSVATAHGPVSSTSMPSSVTFTLDNSGGAVAKDYKIGDTTGGIAALVGRGTSVVPDSSSGATVAFFQYSLGVAPVTVQAINYSATSGAVQFPQYFAYATGDINGRVNVTPLNTPEYQRNNAFNANLLTLEFPNQFKLDWNDAFFITAGIGQVVSVTLMFGAAAYR
jgi:hypothetical protein